VGHHRAQAGWRASSWRRRLISTRSTACPPQPDPGARRRVLGGSARQRGAGRRENEPFAGLAFIENNRTTFKAINDELKPPPSADALLGSKGGLGARFGLGNVRASMTMGAHQRRRVRAGCSDPIVTDEQACPTDSSTPARSRLQASRSSSRAPRLQLGFDSGHSASTQGGTAATTGAARNGPDKRHVNRSKRGASTGGARLSSTTKDRRRPRRRIWEVRGAGGCARHP